METTGPPIVPADPPEEHRAAEVIIEELQVSERRERVIRKDEEAPRQPVAAMACNYGGCGYGQITALLRNDGWDVNRRRIARIWGQYGLEVPQTQPRRRRL